MDVLRMSPSGSATAAASDDEMDLKRGPWTAEEDVLLANYIAANGEGRWNSLARYAGLKRTGKSCRLRWLNYLRPDVRRGNITSEEQLLILELHSRWGNRWSKIAQHLPGRTDNEIKNYWRTRVQKHAKQLKCDVNSKQFRDVMRHVWMPRLVERIQADSATATTIAATNVTTTTASSPRESAAPHLTVYQNVVPNDVCHTVPSQAMTMSPDSSSTLASSSEASIGARFPMNPVMTDHVAGWSMVQCGGETASMDNDMIHCDVFSRSWSELLAATGGDGSDGMPDFEFGDSSWTLEDIFLQQRF